MVLVLTALVASLAAGALRDSAASALEQEATRLAALLESARAESRAAGVAVRFELSPSGHERDFDFVGWPNREPLPRRWLNPEVRAEIIGARPVLLGPEPLIGAQRLRLRLSEHQLVLITDGLAPFSIESAPAP